jgi:hypothetical protein
MDRRWTCQMVSAESYTACRPAANDAVAEQRDAAGIPGTERLMTSNVRTTTTASAPVAARPVSEPAVTAASALSTQPPRATQRATRTTANFDPASSREALIATAAYYRAQKRGFQPGHEIEDWLAAEREIDGAGSEPI